VVVVNIWWKTTRLIFQI